MDSSEGLISSCANSALFRPAAERARGAAPPCGSGSFENRQRRGVGRARGAVLPCVPGSLENRQRLGVGPRVLRYLDDRDVDYPTAAIGSIKLGSLFLTLPTRGLTGQQIISSAEAHPVVPGSSTYR